MEGLEPAAAVQGPRVLKLDCFESWAPTTFSLRYYYNLSKKRVRHFDPQVLQHWMDDSE